MTDRLASLLTPFTADNPAIGAPGREWLSYGALRTQIETIDAHLAQIGLGPGDRVAMVLPNGPEMAAAFVCVAQTCTAAPLNPSYRTDEYIFYLKDLKASALLVSEDYDGPALNAARQTDTAILRLSVPPGAPAGAFTVRADTTNVPKRTEPHDRNTALILHTSGTTSRPKIVPLNHTNIIASARNVQTALRLGPVDRCLNIMPLFHIHGLIGALMGSLASGGSICCSPGFDAIRVFGWMKVTQPTWITAVPTMYQAMLARAPHHGDTISETPLRFVRSSSASLPPQVMTALHDRFGVPVIESYGMTEATHQMTSNPLPSGTQIPGSVGRAAGPEVRIADEAANVLIDHTGEVVISGPNVTEGYESNPKANADSFFVAEGERWFRTGDQGRFDSDGYLHLTGRLKEIINRGGEKISPLEVDGILMDHPDIIQVVTFALPHPKLGEDIAAAVVLSEGSKTTPTDIRTFAASHIADFKVPGRVVILNEIPKGATGKMQRIGLAEKLGLIT